MFKTETRYALHAVTVLARSEGLVRNSELAAHLNISLPMVAKIQNRLVQAGLVVSRPGPGGGYALARPAADIRLREVVAPTEGENWGHGCLLGLPRCDDENPCAMHPAWLKLRTHILAMLNDRTVAEMAAGTVEIDLRVEGSHELPQA
ncbi:Rrf2 family transcriptional regulator [bacterium]|nr:Rrf2 family transcriptional regulator [bacterium]MBU1674389.1 Rrf2 family transcriptional regulator [bacterium]